ncbi:MAG: hypothetical protein QM586_06790 [Xenophilus sp.]
MNPKATPMKDRMTDRGLPLPRWEADLIGDEQDLSHLVSHFTADDCCIYFDEVATQTLLVIPGFAQDADAEEVHAAAAVTARQLSGVLRIALRSVHPVRIGGVQRRLEGGRRYIYVSIHAEARASAEFHAETLIRGEDGQWIVLPPAPPDTVLFMMLACTDSTVAKAMRFVTEPDADAWTGLFRLFELIAHDLYARKTSIEAKGWASKTMQKRFEHTANSSAAGDASRHGYEDRPPPGNPMSIENARSFVQQILHAWMADKLNHSG